MAMIYLHKIKCKVSTTNLDFLMYVMTLDFIFSLDDILRELKEGCKKFVIEFGLKGFANQANI